MTWRENTMGYLHQGITDVIIRCFYTVYNTLGYGFLEKVYERAMMIELRLAGLTPVSQSRVAVYYKGEKVGEYSCDILVNDTVVVELKATDTLANEHSMQLDNYLKSTMKEVGLLLNFGPSPQIRRRIFTNDRKRWMNARTDDPVPPNPERSAF
jgi:GxxExxY protein